MSGVAFRTALVELEGSLRPSGIHHRKKGCLEARMLIVVNLPAATFSLRPDWFSAVDLDCCQWATHRRRLRLARADRRQVHREVQHCEVLVEGPQRSQHLAQVATPHVCRSGLQACLATLDVLLSAALMWHQCFRKHGLLVQTDQSSSYSFLHSCNPRDAQKGGCPKPTRNCKGSQAATCL